MVQGYRFALPPTCPPRRTRTAPSTPQRRTTELSGKRGTTATCTSTPSRKAVTWTTDNDGHVDEEKTTWDEVDACHGYYGDKHAKEAAPESLNHYHYAPESKEA